MAKRKRFEDYMLLAQGERVPGPSTTYEVGRVAGTGAFAAVYAASDPNSPGRRVALKEFFPARHPREQAALQALFEREATVGMLASPHPLMPTFYEAFQHDSHYYVAQEFIEGSTLDEIIFKRHPLPREWILKWAVSLCDALAFLHSRQVVHHDLKPANIRITPQGHLALLDFGAAQYFGSGHEHDKPVELYGTEGYLPPELEADGTWVADVRTDIFALGCILYEMIAGAAPDQDSINDRSMYVTNSLIQRPNADLGLVKLINKALSYNTEYRFASANDFLLEMRSIAPPVLLVSRKHVRWGQVRTDQTVSPETFWLYNAGGGEIRGEIKPRAPWISVPANTFRGNRREVSVQVNTTKIAERGQLQVGRLEINTPDIRDADGALLSTGDRWFIECSITLIARPAKLEFIPNPGSPRGPITLSVRKGQVASATFEIENVGEIAADFHMEPANETSSAQGPPPSGLTILPATGHLDKGKRITITVSVPTADLTMGSHSVSLKANMTDDQTLVVPITVHVLSTLDYWKSKAGIRSGK